MSFFEPPSPPPSPPQRFVAPEWVGPADNVLPAPFPLDELLARTESVALAARGGRAYANGIEFALEIRRRKASTGRRTDPISRWHETYESGDLPEDVLRFGVEFADGRKATVFDHSRFRPGGWETPPPIALQQRGGGGGMHHWDIGFWLWPMPPQGPLALVVEWPSESVSLTRVEIDTAPIHVAAGRAIELWPDTDGPEIGGGSMIVQMIRESDD
jgi:hypothetical protein